MFNHTFLYTAYADETTFILSYKYAVRGNENLQFFAFLWFNT